MGQKTVKPKAIKIFFNFSCGYFDIRCVAYKSIQLNFLMVFMFGYVVTHNRGAVAGNSKVSGGRPPAFEKNQPRYTPVRLTAGLGLLLLTKVIPLILGQITQKRINIVKATMLCGPFDVLAKTQNFRKG